MRNWPIATPRNASNCFSITPVPCLHCPSDSQAFKGLKAGFADVPLEAPTVRGFVTLLWEGTQGASVDDLAALSYDLISQAGLKEILGMQRMNGLAGVLRRLKKIVVETAAS